MSLNFIPAGDSIRPSVHGLRVNNYLPMIFNDTFLDKKNYFEI